MARISGAQAEQLALNYLLQQGLELIQRNFYSRFGEIDLIMRENKELLFIEVKQRRSGLDEAIASITPLKQQKLIKTAQFFLLKLGHEVNCRFDAVVLNESGKLEWLKNIITLEP